MKDSCSRRSFIKSVGALGTSIALDSPVSTLFEGARDQVIKVGVIGTGSRGSGLIRVINELPQLRIEACCDILPFRLKEVLPYIARGAKRYSDYRALLDNPQVEAVIIATPLYLHAPMAVDALDAGMHVYCEKTMAFEQEETLQLVESARKHPDLAFQVGHQYHSSRLYHKVVELIQNRQIGTVTGFECQWNRNGNWRREVPDPTLEKIINWRMYREYSGGLLAELAAHQIDFVNWVTGQHPLKVVGTGGIDYWKDGRETYDNVHAIFDYPQGIKASFACTTANAYEGYQIKVLGDKATVVIKPDRAWIYPESKEPTYDTSLVDGVSSATKSTVEEYGAIPINIEHADPTKQALADFYDSIAQRKSPLSNVFSGAKVSFSVQMALRSMLENRAIHWQNSFSFG